MAADTSQIGTPIADEVASYGVVDEAVIASLRAREGAGELSSTDPEVQALLAEARGAVVDMKEAELQLLHAKSDFITAAKQVGQDMQRDLYRDVEHIEKEDEEKAAKDMLAGW